MVMVHGDDFVSVGARASAQAFREKLEKRSYSKQYPFEYFPILKGSSKLHEHYMNASPRLNPDSVFDMYYIEYCTALQDLVCACAEQAHFVSYH